MLIHLVLLAGCAGPPEERCYDDVECAGGFCESGACVPRAQRGQSCWRSSAYHDGSGLVESNCAAGLVCASHSHRCESPAPMGARCGDDGDCGAHHGYRSADAPICDPATDPPRCAAPRSIPAGGACLGHRACGADLRCRANADGSSTCRGPGAVGEACVGRSGPPEPEPSCEPGLYCAPGSPWTCQVRAGLGESCADSECEEGLVCRGGSRLCGYASAATEACGVDEDCRAGLVCIAGACAPRSSTGGPCDAEDHCAGDGDSCILGVCAARSVAGGPCAFPGDCAIGLRCDMGTCIATRKVGEPCQSHYACEARSICLDNVCRDTGGPGEPCDSASDCRAGLFCQSNVCVWRRPDGAPCRYDYECRSDACSWLSDDDAPSSLERACGPASW
ncbi:MAG TPA: hypothetical protein VGD74_05115 [Vulgatibacter sp.]